MKRLRDVISSSVVYRQQAGGPTACKRLRRLKLDCGHYQIRTLGQDVPKRVRCDACARIDDTEKR